jgi:single-strand DNA-binding protein
MSINKVILIGRLGMTPEVRHTPGGASVANFNLATNEKWTDKSGQKQERTEWHKVVTWGKNAELAGKYLVKGREVYVEGRIQTREFLDKDGQKKYATEVQAERINFLGGTSADGKNPPKLGALAPADESGPEPDMSKFDDLPF